VLIASPCRRQPHHHVGEHGVGVDPFIAPVISSQHETVQSRPPIRRSPGLPLGGDDPEIHRCHTAAAAPVISVLGSYGLDGEAAFYAALEFWSAMPVSCCWGDDGRDERIDTDAVSPTLVMRLGPGIGEAMSTCASSRGA